MPSISIRNTNLTSGDVPSGSNGSFGQIPTILNNIQESILIANEDGSVTGHSNSSVLIPERIDLSGINLTGIGGVVPSVLIDNIYNSNKIEEWNYAYQKVVQSIDITLNGNTYTITIYFLDGTSIYDTFTVVNNQATETTLGVAEIATQAETNAGTDDERIVTPLKLKALLDSRVGGYAANVGNSSATSFAITHNLGTIDVVVMIKDNTTLEEVFTDVVITNSNTVTVSFITAPSTNAYRVIIKK